MLKKIQKPNESITAEIIAKRAHIILEHSLRVYPYTEIYHTRYTKKYQKVFQLSPEKTILSNQKLNHHQGHPHYHLHCQGIRLIKCIPKDKKKPYFLDFTPPHPPDRNSTSAIPQLLLTRFWDQQQQQQHNNNNINYKISPSPHPPTAC